VVLKVFVKVPVKEYDVTILATSGKPTVAETEVPIAIEDILVTVVVDVYVVPCV